MSESSCIGCGCTDSQACDLGCHWVRRDERRRVGICSTCAVLVPVWDAGVRSEAHGRPKQKIGKLWKPKLRQPVLLAAQSL